MHKLILPAALLGFMAAGAAHAADTGPSMEEGKQIYDKTCSSCHKTGKMGAPVAGSAEDWADLEQTSWTDALAEHLDEGFLKTADKDPKKGVTEQQMEAAVAYIESLQ